MLPNRIYTPQELQALARRTPAEPPPRAGPGGDGDGSTGSGPPAGLLAALQRIAGRRDVRRPAPGTT